jgi:hypothetical protein
MANIPPQENWFMIAERTASANTAGEILGNQTYTCPRNRNAIIVSWYADEISDGATIGAYFSPDGATDAPGALPYGVKVGPTIYSDVTTPGYYGQNMINVCLGPGDTFFIGVVTSDGSASWDSCFSVREIGPASGNMGAAVDFV